MGEPFAILRKCHACGQAHYAVDWFGLPLVEQVVHKSVGTAEVRACMKCGERLHVWADDARESLAGLRSLLIALRANEAPLHWATAWSQNGEEPLSRAWRHEPDPEALIAFLEWSNARVAWEAVAIIAVAAGLTQPIAFTRTDSRVGPEAWFSDHAYGRETHEDAYLCERIREAFEAPTLSDCVRVMRERARAA